MTTPWQGLGAGVLVGVDTAVLPAATAGASVLAVLAPARLWPAFCWLLAAVPDWDYPKLAVSASTPRIHGGRLLGAATLEPAASFRLFGHLSLRVSAGISIALERPEFYFQAADGARHPIYRADVVGVFAGVGFIADRF